MTTPSVSQLMQQRLAEYQLQKKNSNKTLNL